MKFGQLGKKYPQGTTIIRQGEVGDCMYVVQEGQVEVLRETDGEEVRLAVLNEGDSFGEMALFEREVRSATVRALGDAHILTVDKKGFLRRIHEDPSLAYSIIQQMSRRIRRVNSDFAQLVAQRMHQQIDRGGRRFSKERRGVGRRVSRAEGAFSPERRNTDRRGHRERRVVPDRRSVGDRREAHRAVAHA